MIRRGSTGRLGAALLLAGPLLAWLAELVTAAAWQNPPYAPLYNWVSHLGVPGPRQVAFHQVVNSPLAWVIDTAWIVYGAVAATGFALFLRLRDGLRPRVLGALALISGLGIVLVAVFHGSQQNVDNGLIKYHLMGAQAAIVAGNVSAILVGSFRAWIGLSGRAATASITVGAIGLICFAIFMADYRSGLEWDLGLFERGAIYGPYLGHVILATSLLRHRAAAAATIPASTTRTLTA